MSRKPKKKTVTSPSYPASEELYQALFEQAADGMFIADKQGRCIEVNRHGCEMLGYTREELLGLSMEDLIPAEDLARNPLQLDTLRIGKTLLKERRMRCKDGRLLPVEISAQMLADGRFLGIVRDISKHKQAERELQRSNDLLRAIIEAAPAAVIGLDLDGNVQTVWNPAAEKMLGWSAEEAMGRPLPSVPVESQEEFGRFRERIRSGKTLDGVDVHRQRRDGTPIDYSIYTSPLYNAEGQISGNIAVLVDITERKQAERSIALLNFALNNVHEAAFLIDENGRFRYVNEESCRVLGYIRDELLNLSVADVDPDFPAERWSSHWGELKTHRSLVFESRYKTKDGRLIPVEISANYFEYDGQSYNLALARDITERKQTEQSLTIREREYRALVENSPDFIARYDREFRRVYVNPAIQKLFGKPAENVLNKIPDDQSPVYAPQVYIDQLRQVIETGTERAVEMPFRTAQGEMHWGHMRFVPEFGPDGQVASVLAIGRDIHEIKEKEQRFRMLAENFPDFVVRFDRDCRYTYVNPAVE